MGRKSNQEEYRQEILELIENMRLNLDDPLPKTPFQRKKIDAAKESLSKAELAVQIGKAEAAFLYACEYKDYIHEAKSEEILRAHKNLGGYKQNSEMQKVTWLVEAWRIRQKDSSISKLKIAKTIAPGNIRSARRFLAECEKEGSLPKQLAK